MPHMGIDEQQPEIEIEVGTDTVSATTEPPPEPVAERAAVAATLEVPPLQATLAASLAKELDPADPIEPERVIKALEILQEELQDAIDGPLEFGQPAPLVMIPKAQLLASHTDQLAPAILDFFGVDPTAPNVVKEYSYDGPEGREGTANVQVIATKHQDVLLAIDTFANGDTWWEITHQDIVDQI